MSGYLPDASTWPGGACRAAGAGAPGVVNTLVGGRGRGRAGPVTQNMSTKLYF